MYDARNIFCISMVAPEKSLGTTAVDDVYIQMWHKRNLTRVYDDHMKFVHLVHFAFK
jgi:hypothetical protein